jgi:hypothetical protein
MQHVTHADCSSADPGIFNGGPNWRPQNFDDLFFAPFYAFTPESNTQVKLSALAFLLHLFLFSLLFTSSPTVALQAHSGPPVPAPVAPLASHGGPTPAPLATLCMPGATVTSGGPG